MTDLERGREAATRDDDDESSSFVEAIAAELSCEPDEAERLAVAVIATLEESLTHDDAEELDAELPARVRDLVARDPRLLDAPGMDMAMFVRRVAHRTGMTEDDAARTLAAVISVLREHVSPREARRIATRLAR
jgi:uncharacterized protein (DUF2267 family)